MPIPVPLSQYDWCSWTPGMLSTLVFVFRDAEVLLIKKKTGLGKGKVNAPGGKLEPGETAMECAQREVKEEVGLHVSSLREVAELRFLMSDHVDIHCRAYFTHEFSGTPIETREATPFWCPLSQIPYHRMWADDHLWLPRTLQGHRLRGSFRFEGEQLKSHWLELIKD